MSRCRRSLRATRAPCLAKSDQGERRGGGGPGTAGLTEKRTLLALGGLQSAPFGHVAAWEVWNQTPRQPAGHYGKWPNWANVLEQPPARLRGGCAERRCRKQTGFGTFAEAATEFRSHPRCSSCGSARAKRDGLAPNDARGWECLGCGRKHGSLAGTAFEHTRRGLPGRVSLIGLMRFSVPLDCIGGRHRRLQNPCAVACGHGKPSHEEDKGGLRRPRSQRRHHRA